MTITVKIPKTFIEDHSERECLRADGDDYRRMFLAEVVTRCLAKHYVVTLTDAQARELLSDADHYVQIGVRELGWHMSGLVASARATRDALVKAGVQQ